MMNVIKFILWLCYSHTFIGAGKHSRTYEMKPHLQSRTAGKPALRTNSKALF